jgi:hypothetical protein
LSVNDSVLVVDNKDQQEILKFSKIVSFLHKIENINAQFKRVHFNWSLNGTTSSSYITLTEKHLIIVGKRNETFNYLPARDIEIGDMLKYYDYNTKVYRIVYVTKIETIVLEKGIYAPLTEQGTIVVDNILVSCYSMVKNHNLAQLFFNVLNNLNLVFKVTSQNYLYYSKFLFQMIDFANLSSLFLNV